MGKLILKPGGLLEYVERGEENKDVTQFALFYLNECVQFDNIILRDIFLLIKKNPVLYPIFGNWLEEYTELALETVFERDPDDMILELYHNIYIDKEDEIFNIPSFPQFHGISVAKEDSEHYKAGETIRWALDLSPLESIIDLPIVCRDTIEFNYYDNDNRIFSKTFNTQRYTLYQIILGVIWEIAFCGSPEDKQDKADMLIEAMRRVLGEE